MKRNLSLGSGYSYRTFTEKGSDAPTGMILTGPAGKHCPHQRRRRCAGGVNFEGSRIAASNGSPVWKVTTQKPLSLTPSIRCSCDIKHPGEGQHGYITNGRWVNANGIVAE